MTTSRKNTCSHKVQIKQTNWYNSIIHVIWGCIYVYESVFVSVVAAITATFIEYCFYHTKKIVKWGKMYSIVCDICTSFAIWLQYENFYHWLTFDIKFTVNSINFKQFRFSYDVAFIYLYKCIYIYLYITDNRLILCIINGIVFLWDLLRQSNGPQRKANGIV